MLLTGCSGELLVEAAPPWAPDAQLVLMVLDDAGEPDAPPQLFRAGEKLEIVLPKGATREVVIHEYAADAKAPDGSPLLDCGAQYAESDSPIEGLVAQYRSGLVDRDNAEDFRLAPVMTTPIPLFHARCTVSTCQGIDVDTVTIPFSGVLRNAAGIGKDDFYVIGNIDATADSPPMALTKVVNRLPLPVNTPGLLGYSTKLVFDGDRTFYGSANPDERVGGHLFAFDMEGAPQPVPALDLGTTAKRIAMGKDGSLFAGGANGLFEITKGSTIATRVEAYAYAAEALAVANRGRMVVLDPRPAINFYDGNDWTTEWVGGTLTQIEDLAIDDDRAYAIGSFGTILKRNEANRVWEPVTLPESESGGNVGAIVLLQGGRFAIGLDRGGLGVWNGSGWCFDEATANSGHVLNLSAAPGGLFAFGVPRVPDPTGSKIVILEVKRK